MVKLAMLLQAQQCSSNCWLKAITAVLQIICFNLVCLCIHGALYSYSNFFALVTYFPLAYESVLVERNIQQILQ